MRCSSERILDGSSFGHHWTSIAKIGYRHRTAVSPGVHGNMWVMISMTGVDRSGYLAESSFMVCAVHVHNAE